MAKSSTVTRLSLLGALTCKNVAALEESQQATDSIPSDYLRSDSNSKPEPKVAFIINKAQVYMEAEIWLKETLKSLDVILRHLNKTV